MATTTNAPEPKAPAKVPTKPIKAIPARTARVTGGAKPAKQRKTAQKTNGTTTPKAPAKTKAKAQRKGGTPVRAKSDFTNDQVLTLKKVPEGGFLAERYKLIKSGQTVGEALAGFKGLRRRRESMRKLIEGGFVSVK